MGDEKKFQQTANPEAEYELAHGTHKHKDGDQVVELKAGDKVKLTDSERKRLDPHGVKFKAVEAKKPEKKSDDKK